MIKLFKGFSLLSKEELLQFLCVILISVISAVFSVISFMTLYQFLNYVQDNNNIGSILKLIKTYATFENLDYQVAFFSLCVAVLFLLTTVFLIIRSYVTNNFSLGLIHSLSERALKIALTQNYRTFSNKSAGKLSALILSETEHLVHKYYRPFINATSSFFFSLILVAFLSLLNLIITLSITASLALFYLCMLVLLQSSLFIGGAQRKVANEERYKLVNEALTGIKTVKIFNLEKSVNANFSDLTKKMVKQIVRSVMLSEIPSYIMQGLLFGGSFLVLAVFALVSDVHLFFANNVSTLVVFTAVILRLLPEFQRVYNGFSNASFSMESIDAYAAFVAQNACQSNEEGVTPVLPLKIKFEDVNVDYGDSVALRDVNLEIDEGETIGIVGRSGSGKTTLLDVVMGILEPTSGDILVNDISLKDIDKKQWMQFIGYVPQNIFLMNRSLVENITLSEESNRDEVKYLEAINKALLLEFVENRNDTLAVGDAGAKMSGGQVQRAGIARAIYRNIKLLVLDEATSSLDISSEKQILENIFDNSNVTTIMVTHRLDALSYCDKIAIMDQGKILHFGSAAEIFPLIGNFFKEYKLEN